MCRSNTRGAGDHMHPNCCGNRSVCCGNHAWARPSWELGQSGIGSGNAHKPNLVPPAWLPSSSVRATITPSVHARWHSSRDTNRSCSPMQRKSLASSQACAASLGYCQEDSRMQNWQEKQVSLGCSRESTTTHSSPQSHACLSCRRHQSTLRSTSLECTMIRSSSASCRRPRCLLHSANPCHPLRSKGARPPA